MPFFDSAFPPMTGRYEDPAQRAWAAHAARADAFVIVTPEYNHGYPAVLKNALDMLYAEWRGKAVGFVGYGGPGGGIRAVEQLRQVVVELDMVPLREQVVIPRVYAAFDDEGQLRNPHHAGQATAVLTASPGWPGDWQGQEWPRDDQRRGGGHRVEWEVGA